MIEILKQIIHGALENLSEQSMKYLPPLLAAVAILLIAWLAAHLARWACAKFFRGIELDRWLRRSGLSEMIDPAGRIQGARAVPRVLYWAILGAGLLTALNAFNTQLTSRMVEALVFFFPKLISAGAILLAGGWLSRYLSSRVLVWAVNEEIPWPRRLAGLVRVLVMFVTVVATADYLNFARGVFLSAFILVVGGAALGAALALGLGCREPVRRFLEQRSSQETAAGRSLWDHL